MKKTCKKCGIEKDLNEYHKSKNNKYGRNDVCKSCRREAAAEKYKADWFHQTAILKKAQCKKLGVDFDLDSNYLESIWTDTCPVFNKKFVRHEKGHDLCPTLDRVDPSKGYTKGNVRYISARANRIKYDASVEELKKVLAYMEGATTIPQGSTLK